MSNEQPPQPIESLDVLVHPFFGMSRHVPYDGDFFCGAYNSVGVFAQEHFPGHLPGHAYARLLAELWKERIRTIAPDPAHALLFVPYAGSGLMHYPLTPQEEEIRNLALFAKGKLGNRCIIGLPRLEQQARQKVVQRCTPDSTLPIHSYGEISHLCVLGEVADLMTPLFIRGVQFEHHPHLELCGDRIEGKREAYARLYPQPEVHL